MQQHEEEEREEDGESLDPLQDKVKGKSTRKGLGKKRILITFELWTESGSRASEKY